MIDIKKQAVFESTDKMVVVGTVFSPNTKDTDGEWMQPETIEKMRNRFHKLLSMGKADIDLSHNGIPGTGYIIGSWIEKDGSWKLETKIEDETTWKMIKAGQLKGYSIAGAAIEKTKDGELLDCQINKISIVGSPANQKAFEVVKEDKSIIKKAIDYLNKIVNKEDSMEPDKLDMIIEQQKQIIELLSQKKEDQPAEDVEKSEKEKLENRIVELEKQLDVAQGGKSQGKQVDQKTEQQTDDDIFAFLS